MFLIEKKGCPLTLHPIQLVDEYGLNIPSNDGVVGRTIDVD